MLAREKLSATVSVSPSTVTYHHTHKHTHSVTHIDYRQNKEGLRNTSNAATFSATGIHCTLKQELTVEMSNWEVM